MTVPRETRRKIMLRSRLFPVFGLILILPMVFVLSSCINMDGALRDAPVYEGPTLSGMTPFTTDKVDFMVPKGWVAEVPVNQEDKGIANLVSGKELSAKVSQEEFGANILVYRWNMATRDNLHEFLVNVLNDNIMDNTLTNSARRVFPGQTFPVFEIYTGEIIQKGEPVSIKALISWRWALSGKHYSLFCVYPAVHAEKVENEIIALVRTLK
jgi:hypothetical protein